MCKARPGRRCTDGTYKALEKARAELEALGEDARAIDLARARNKVRLAEADYAATFKDINPRLYAAACQIRDEQVALMPPKPTKGDVGYEQWKELARARHELASALTSAHADELQGKAGADSLSQLVFEDAVHQVRQAERAWRAARWADYDVRDVADSRYSPSPRMSERDAQLASDVRRLAHDPAWLEHTHALLVRSQSPTQRYELGVELNRARRAHKVIIELIDQAHPHALLAQGDNLPPSPHLGAGRDPLVTDTPQVRHLAGAGATVRWDEASRCIHVTGANQYALKRLWAYGYHTETSKERPGMVWVSRVPSPCDTRAGRSA